MTEKVFNHTAHKALWNWLAETGENNKEKWIGWQNYNKGYVENYCFACQYDEKNVFDFHYSCCFCPLKMIKCSNKNSLFSQWDGNKSIKERKRIAEIIANLPVKEGVKCI